MSGHWRTAAILHIVVLAAAMAWAQAPAEPYEAVGRRAKPADTLASDVGERDTPSVVVAHLASSTSGQSPATEYRRVQVIPSMAVWGIAVPDDYQRALFENIVAQLRRADTFPNVVPGDGDADPATLKLVTTVTEFNPGDQEIRRRVGLGFGTTRMTVRVRFLDARTCATILEGDADGKVVGGWIDGGDSLNVTLGVAKDIAKMAARVPGLTRPDAGTRCDPGGTLTPVSETTVTISPVIADLTAKAEQGDRASQLELAIRYAHGAGVTKNEALAMKWCKLAAEAGDPIAQTELAIRYDAGWGLPNDDAASLAWVEKAAAQEYPEALLQLGVRHLWGMGVRRDLAEAMRLYRRAAEAGHPRAMCYLGDMHLEGVGTKMSTAEAYRWYVSAVAAGYHRCEPNMTRAGKLLGPDQRAAAERDGRERATRYSAR
jgi:hypothetical protein